MPESRIRPMQRGDWVPTVTKLTGVDGKPFHGFARADGQGGNPLFAALPDDMIEQQLSAAYRALCARYPALTAARYHAKMPYWHGEHTPTPADYTWVDAAQALTTTAITVILIPQRQIEHATLGFHFQGSTLPPLRVRLQGIAFRGLVGNLGYYMTAGLVNDKFRWSHNQRYPRYPLPEIPSYIGFHWCKDADTGTVSSAFESAHLSAVALRTNGEIEIVHHLKFEANTVHIGARKVQVDAINAPDATGADVAVFTPALRTPEVEHYIRANEQSGARSMAWQSYAPVIPLSDARERVHVFIANQSHAHMPQEQIVAVWEGTAPLPSFGAVLSFKRAYFNRLFGSIDAFKAGHLNRPVRIVPSNAHRLNAYQCMLGGLVPAVIDGQHLYHAPTVSNVLHNLGQFGNATSPIAQTGRETQNFDPYLREPAGLLIQTPNHTGWVLFDGRHELSIGASVVDVALLLKKLESAGHLAGETVRQAVFVDGGSAMKIYDVASEETQTRLEPLNRTAAGARNGPSPDYEGLNLYSTLSLALDMPPER